MKEMFATLIINNGTYTTERQEGEYDSKTDMYYDKTKDGWRATDKYSGMALVSGSSTKKECQEKVSQMVSKLKEYRNTEKYLQTVINFEELLEDEAQSKPF